MNESSAKEYRVDKTLLRNHSFLATLDNTPPESFIFRSLKKLEAALRPQNAEKPGARDAT